MADNDLLLPSDQPGYSPAPPKAEWSDVQLPSDVAAGTAMQPQGGDMSLWDATKSAVGNIPASAGRFAVNVAQPFLHPIQTAENIGNVGMGALEKTGLVSGDEHVKYANAVGQNLAERYGGWGSLKKTFADDPVGVLADASLAFTGVGGLAARAPGIIGDIGDVAATAGRLTNPLYAPAKAVGAAGKLAGKGAAELIGGLGTHTGPETVETALNAGLEGGKSAYTFKQNMRGNIPSEDTVAMAQSAMRAYNKQLGSRYEQDMARIGADTTVLPFDKINQALADVTKIRTFKGIPIDDSAQTLRQNIAQEIGQWARLDPAQYHTVAGLDALKQRIYTIGGDANTPAERLIAGRAYNAIKQTIADQAPEYEKVMNGYARGKAQLEEIEKTFSLGDKATIDTSLRKLQAILRNNVSSAYGHRRELAQWLIENGAPHLTEALAGQAMQPWMPRGLGRLALGIGAEMGLLLGGHTALGAGLGAATVPAVAAMSPRIVGETAYRAGAMARPFYKANRFINQVAPQGVTPALSEIGKANNLKQEQP